jgi:hypothetical protein
MPRKILTLFPVLALSVALAVTEPAADRAAAATPTAGVAVTSSLTCTAKSGYTSYTITGTLTMPNVPSNLTISWLYHYSRYTSSGTTSNVVPVLDNTYAGGYYLSTYGYNAWKAGNVVMLLPNYTWGAVAVGGLVAGSTQMATMTCKAPAATGVTGTLTCVAKVTGDPTTYTVSGTVVQPATLTNTTVSVTRSGTTTAGSPTTPVLDNTLSGGYWLATYGYNSWNLNANVPSGTWLLVPSGGLSPSFSGLMMNVYQGAGNVQLQTKCTIV